MTFKDWITQEHDRDIEQRVKAATTFNMPEDDREMIRGRVLQYARMKPVRTPVASRQGSSWISIGLHPMPIIAMLLIAVVGTGSAGAATLAEAALPGDLLYPIKVNVNEEVRLALATTPQKKAEVAIARAETRIEELNTLTQRGEIEESVRVAIDERIDAQVHDAEEKSSEADERDEGRLVAVLRAHESLIGAFEIGGGAEPEVEFATFVAADTATSSNTTTLDVTVPEVALTAPTSPEETSTPKEAARARNISTNNVAQESSQKKSSSSEKAVLRQKKAATQRLASLENLLNRLENKTAPEVLSQVEADLAAAQQAVEEGNTFIESGAWGDASVRFNAAVRIAIDAREALLKSVNKNKSERSGDNSDSNRGHEGSSQDNDND